MIKIHVIPVSRPIIFLLCAGIASLMPGIQTAAAEFTITGTLTFEKTGALVVMLVDEAQFNCDDDNQQQECPETARLKLMPNAQELQQHAIAFTLTNLPQGTYALQAYQDVNGNNDCDEGALGPKEPWGMSHLTKKPTLRAPKWDEVKFDVSQDVSGLTIVVK